MNRRDFLKAAALAGLGAMAPGGAWAMGEESKFTIACDRHTFNYLIHNGFSE